MSRRWRLALVVGGALLLVAAGAGLVRWLLVDSRPVLTAEMVTGTWRGSGGTELIVDAGGSFRAPRVPSSLLRSDREQPTSVSGAGRWELDSGSSDTSGRITQLALIFETLQGIDGLSVPYRVYLRSYSDDGRIVLFWYVGISDLDHRYVLEKS